MSAQAWLIIAIIGFSLGGISLIVAIFMFIKMNIPSVIGDLTGKTVAREIKAMREFNEKNGDRRFKPSQTNLERGTLTNQVDLRVNNASVMAQAHVDMRLDNNPNIANAVNPQPIVAQQNSWQQSNATNSSFSGINDFKNDSNVSPLKSTEVLSNAINTSVEDSNATEVLSDDTSLETSNATEVLSDDTSLETSNATEVLSDDTSFETSNATEVLSDDTSLETSNATEVLSDDTSPETSNATEVLSDDTSFETSNATEVLSDDYQSTDTNSTTVLSDATTILSEDEQTATQSAPKASFSLIRNRIIVNTNEVI